MYTVKGLVTPTPNHLICLSIQPTDQTACVCLLPVRPSVSVDEAPPRPHNDGSPARSPEAVRPHIPPWGKGEINGTQLPLKREYVTSRSRVKVIDPSMTIKSIMDYVMGNIMEISWYKLDISGLIPGIKSINILHIITPLSFFGSHLPPCFFLHPGNPSPALHWPSSCHRSVEKNDPHQLGLHNQTWRKLVRCKTSSPPPPAKDLYKKN